MKLEAISHTIKEEPMITGKQSFSSVTDTIAKIPESKTPTAWYIAISISFDRFSMYLAYRLWKSCLAVVAHDFQHFLAFTGIDG